jgi:hypothetical protein
MPLDTKVKTVLMHDGPFDESDRFLLRAPATDYIENLQFHRQGNLQKRRGNAEIATVPNANGEPFFIQSIKNNLHVLTEDGGRSLSDGAWTEVDAVGFVGTKKMELETPPVGGMGHLDFVWMGQSGAPTELKWFIMVYEVRERSTSSSAWGLYQDTPKHVVVQSYDKDGNFMKQSRIENARSPKVFIHPDSDFSEIFAKVFYVRDSDSRLVSRSYDPTAATPLSSSVQDSGFEIATDYGMESHATKNLSGSIFDGAGAFNHTRLGASQDGHARYHMTANWSSGSPEFYVIWRSPTGNVWVGDLDASGLPGNRVAIAVATASKSYEPFDIVWNPAAPSRNAYALWGEFEAATSAPWDTFSRVWVTKLDFDESPIDEIWNTEVYTTTGNYLSSPPERLNASQFTHGGLSVWYGAVVTGVAWMVHDSGPCVGRVPTNPDGDLWTATRHWNQGLRYGTVTSAGGIDVSSKTVPAQRLATRPFWYFGQLYAGVQQHIDHSIQSRGKTQEGYSGVTGALVPRTTTLLCFGDGSENPRPVAYVGAGISKVTEYAESELATHVPSVRFQDDDILLPNRIVLRAEDLSESFYDSVSGDFWYRLGAAESPSDALCRVHRVTRGQSGNEQIHTAILGDGAVLATAVPLWFDGRFFGELGPIDQPEIISLRDDRMMEAENWWETRVPQNYKVGHHGTDEKWRKLQIVVGYYDTQGNKHRSAPSSVLYVWGFHPDDADPRDFEGTGTPETWHGQNTRIYYTPPLSVVPSDIEYFVEVYASDDPFTAPQLIDTGTIRVDDLNRLHYIEVQLLRYLGLKGDPLFGMPPRGSETIYTAGGELPSDPWPSFTRATVTSTRLFALDAVNKGKVLVSKRFQDFIAPEYNALLDINLGDERDLLCIGKMDDKTIIFEKDDIHVLYGDGPENNGQGEEFAVHYISTDVGCEDQESIVECPAGLVFFRKERGFYLLDRQLNIKYIGDKVHDLSQGIDVISAELVSYEGQVRFLCKVTGEQTDIDGEDPAPSQTRPPRPVFGNRPPSSDFAIVWDYEKDQWSVFANYPGAASTIHQGRYTRLLSDWTIWQERASSDQIYLDPAGTNRTLVRSPWIPIGESDQGYNRLHRMNILGRYLSTLGALQTPGTFDACDIQVKVWYDYEEGVDVTPQTKLFRHQDFGFDPFSKRGIRAERLQFTITPPEGRGRCQAVKLEFEEVKPADDPGLGSAYVLGQGFEISSIDFEIGVDQRVTRLLPQAVLK